MLRSTDVSQTHGRYHELKNLLGENLAFPCMVIVASIANSEDIRIVMSKIEGALNDFPIERVQILSSILLHILVHELLQNDSVNNNDYKNRLISQLINHKSFYCLMATGKIHVWKSSGDAENILEALFKAKKFDAFTTCFITAATLCGGEHTAAFKQFKLDTKIDDRTSFTAILKTGEEKCGDCRTQRYRSLITSVTIDTIPTTRDKNLFELFLQEGKRAYDGNLYRFIHALNEKNLLDNFLNPKKIPPLVILLEQIAVLCGGTGTDEFRTIFLDFPWFMLTEKGDAHIVENLFMTAEQILGNAPEIFTSLRRAKRKAQGDNANQYSECVIENLTSTTDEKASLSPFLKVVQDGKVDIVKFLFMNFPEKVRTALLRDQDPHSGCSALNMACSQSNVEMTQLLLEEGKKLWENNREALVLFLDCKDGLGRTPVEKASIRKNQTLLDLLVQHNPRLVPPPKRKRDEENNLPPPPPPLEKPSLSSGKKSYPPFLDLLPRKDSDSSHRSASKSEPAVKKERSTDAAHTSSSLKEKSSSSRKRSYPGRFLDRPSREHSSSSEGSVTTQSGRTVVKKEKLDTQQTQLGNFFRRSGSPLPNGKHQSSRQNGRSARNG